MNPEPGHYTPPPIHGGVSQALSHSSTLSTAATTTNPTNDNDILLCRKVPDVDLDLDANAACTGSPGTSTTGDLLDEGIPSIPSSESGLQGGRLWKLAGEVAAVADRSTERNASSHEPLTSANTHVDETSGETLSSCTNDRVPPIHPACLEEGRPYALADAEDKHDNTINGNNSNNATRRVTHPQWAETFMENTRSRATPTAPATHLAGFNRSCKRVRLDEDEDYVFTGLASKRVKVAQLLIAGIVGILVGWLGNAVVGTSCHFASVQVEVGKNSDLFSLHFGLYKYSTVDSSLNGFKYCYPYTGQHINEAPITSRVSNLLALLSGTFTLTVVWGYLIMGQVNATFWKWAVRAAMIAGLCQFGTLLFFAERLCRNNVCYPGPASYLALGTAIVWVILGMELQYNMPCQNIEGVTHLEMADLAVASHEYMERFTTTATNTLTSTAATGTSRRRREPYQPPELT